jgi:hypothetical protein
MKLYLHHTIRYILNPTPKQNPVIERLKFVLSTLKSYCIVTSIIRGIKNTDPNHLDLTSSHINSIQPIGIPIIIPKHLKQIGRRTPHTYGHLNSIRWQGHSTSILLIICSIDLTSMTGDSIHYLLIPTSFKIKFLPPNVYAVFKPKVTKT